MSSISHEEISANRNASVVSSASSRIGKRAISTAIDPSFSDRVCSDFAILAMGLCLSGSPSSGLTVHALQICSFTLVLILRCSP